MSVPSMFQVLRQVALAATFVWFVYIPASMAADGATHSGGSNRFDRAARLVQDNFYDMGDDIRGIATYPFAHPKNTLYSVLGIAALVAVDKPVTRYYQDKVQPVFEGYKLTPPKFIRDLPSGIGKGADGYLILGVAGSYAFGVMADDRKSQMAALLAGKAALYSVVVSQLILKSITGRRRPSPHLSTASGDSGPYTTNPYSFGHVHRPYLRSNAYDTAMPSFHFTLYFAVARVYQKVYHNYLIPYGLAAAGLASDIKGHHHWVSDMVAGALVGTMIGTVVADNALGTDDPSTSANVVLPTALPGGAGLTWIHRF